MPWSQVYDPLGNSFLSTLAAFLPAVVLLVCLGVLRVKAHTAALVGLGAALVVAVAIFGMPPGMAAASAVYGMAYGFLPIGWIIFNVIFLYRLTEEKGLFRVLQSSLTAVTRRLSLTVANQSRQLQELESEIRRVSEELRQLKEIDVRLSRRKR